MAELVCSVGRREFAAGGGGGGDLQFTVGAKGGQPDCGLRTAVSNKLQIIDKSFLAVSLAIIFNIPLPLGTSFQFSASSWLGRLRERAEFQSAFITGWRLAGWLAGCQSASRLVEPSRRRPSALLGLNDRRQRAASNAGTRAEQSFAAGRPACPKPARPRTCLTA